VTTSHTIEVIFGQTTGVDPRSQEFALSRVWPTPSSGRTSAEFSLAREAKVRLSVLDVAGHVVKVLADGTFGPGKHQAQWDGRMNGGPAAPGVYFMRYDVVGRQFVQRLVIVR